MGFYVEGAISSGGLGLAAELEEAGVEVLLGSGGADGLASRDLPLLASLAVGHGLSPKAALAALTTRPARVFDIADKVGSVEIGREADLVLFDGEPFAAATKVKSVICGGDLVVEE
jgi:imidazolonepropionase-like amidohydrolase